MFRRLRWFLNLFSFFLIFVFITYIILGFINLVFELITCQFPPWFPTIREGSELEWDYIKDLYYFLGFLDYAAISLPEVVSCDVKSEDPLLYEVIFFLACIYSGIIENLDKIFYTILGFPISPNDIDINSLLALMDIHENFELKSLMANYTDVILIDSNDGLDKYFVNIKLNGWVRDSWEMKGPQVLYLKNLAKNSYLNSEYVTAFTTGSENFQSFYKTLDKTFGSGDAGILKNLVSVLGDNSNVIGLKNEFNDSSASLLRRQKELGFLTGIDGYYYDNRILCEMDRLSRHYGSFSFFYKLVMHTDKFFFDSLYIYFYFEDLNVMFRIQRIALVDVFSQNIIWGLQDYHRYPVNFAWDYNYYGLVNDAYFNTSALRGQRIINWWSEHFNDFLPFAQILKGDDIFLTGTNWMDHNKSIFFESFYKESNIYNAFYNENLEWISNLSDYKHARWNMDYDIDIYDIKGFNYVGASPELSLDTMCYNEVSEELNREEFWAKKRRRRIFFRMIAESRRHLSRKMIHHRIEYFKKYVSRKIDENFDPSIPFGAPPHPDVDIAL